MLRKLIIIFLFFSLVVPCHAETTGNLHEAILSGNVQLEEQDLPAFTTDNIIISPVLREIRQLTDEIIEKNYSDFENNGTPTCFSLSPSGKSGLLFVNGVVTPFFENNIYPAYVEVKGVASQELDRSYRFSLSERLTRRSPRFTKDGKYTTFYNYMDVMGPFPHDPFYLDLSTGIIHIIDTYKENKSKGNEYYATIAGCFSPDGHYLYYIKFDSTLEKRYTLWQYDMTTHNLNECISIPLYELVPDVMSINENEIIILNKSNEYKYNWIRLKQENDTWVLLEDPFPVDFNYWQIPNVSSSPNGNHIVLLNHKYRRFFMIAKPENNTFTYDIFGVDQNNNIVTMNTDDFSSYIDAYENKTVDRNEFKSIMSTPAISPDEKYLLFVTSDINEQIELNLFEIGTDKCISVQGIDPSLISTPAYTPAIQWLSDTLVIYTDNWHYYKFKE